ncbi:glycoside hydrolase family 25 [Enterococcus faecalis]|nr:glycoside hydrolase family 25 [Enterococcus faecalis]
MTLNVIDISSWQSNINVGHGGVPADGVLVKATGGIGYVNPDCDRAFQQALASGKKVGIYHFAHEAGLQGTAEQEAEFFLQNVQGYIGKAILVLDWESDNKHDVAWAKRWLDYVYQKTGIKPLFYTYLNVLNTYDFSSIAKSDYGLWLAYYGANNPQGYSQPTPPEVPYWDFVTMWQYTSNGTLPNWSGRLDLNVFYGDRESWDKYAQPKQVQKPEKPSNKPITDVIGKPADKEEYPMFIYIKHLKNGHGEWWFVMNGKRMWLPTGKHIEEARALIKRYGGSTNEMNYNYDNFGLAMIEKSTQEVKL